MNSEQLKSIHHVAKFLLLYAEGLEKESANWLPADRSQNVSYDAESAELRRQSYVLWKNAVEMGMIIFEVCGLGAFEDQPRIKNMVVQIRGELRRCLQDFSVPHPHFILNVPYCTHTGRSYDVFFVKMFEGFCKVWITSQEDRYAFECYYDALKIKAHLHAKLMVELAEFLKSYVARNQ